MLHHIGKNQEAVKEVRRIFISTMTICSSQIKWWMEIKISHLYGIYHQKSQNLYTSVFKVLRNTSKQGYSPEISFLQKIIFWIFIEHSVWKSQKKSHSKLRAKQIDKSSLKMPISASFWKPEACSQTVLPDKSVFNRTKIGRKCQSWTIHMRHLQ